MMMKIGIKQALVILILAIIIAILVNTVSPHKISFQGNWPSVDGSSEVVLPPSADENDPPFISLDEAAAKFQLPGVVFVDARDPEDFAVGRIRGSINIPYDYIDDYCGRLDEIPKNRVVVIYCSGSECELSLFLGRDMKYDGYSNIFVFYGGWREWERANLPIESGDGK
nr:rhodanese-like domain-containing protein [candidate division Zixibacteria bacterium]